MSTPIYIELKVKGKAEALKEINEFLLGERSSCFRNVFNAKDLRGDINEDVDLFDDFKTVKWVLDGIDDLATSIVINDRNDGAETLCEIAARNALNIEIIGFNEDEGFAERVYIQKGRMLLNQKRDCIRVIMDIYMSQHGMDSFDPSDFETMDRILKDPDFKEIVDFDKAMSPYFRNIDARKLLQYWVDGFFPGEYLVYDPYPEILIPTIE